jgi:hypothetical protein
MEEGKSGKRKRINTNKTKLGTMEEKREYATEYRSDAVRWRYRQRPSTSINDDQSLKAVTLSASST